LIKVGTTPGSVGKKNGAFSSALGGSMGLLRFYIRGDGEVLKHKNK